MVPCKWDLPQPDGLMLMLRLSSPGCHSGDADPEPYVFQTWSPEEAAGYVVLELLQKKEEKEDAMIY